MIRCMHPWRCFRDLFPHWDLHFADLAVAGRTCFVTGTVTLHSGLLQAERRSVIVHEMHHMVRGPVPQLAHFAAREEAAVRQGTARALISLDALVDAMRWAHDIHELADELWVSVEVAQCRLDHLHPSERHYLRERLSDD